MMGMRMPEARLAVFKRQVINLRSCCILLADSVESMMMHGLATPPPPFLKKVHIVLQDGAGRAYAANEMTRVTEKPLF
jgi:hypothetical protein